MPFRACLKTSVTGSLISIAINGCLSIKEQLWNDDKIRRYLMNARNLTSFVFLFGYHDFNHE